MERNLCEAINKIRAFVKGTNLHSSCFKYSEKDVKKRKENREINGDVENTYKKDTEKKKKKEFKERMRKGNINK